MSLHHDQLAALAARLAQRRDAIMEAWRSKMSADPKLTTGTALPRAQLHDHLPALLQDFERRLLAGDLQTRAAAVAEQKGDAAAHGLHRWQQGFDLSEVSRELGRLNECVVRNSIAAGAPDVEHGAMTEARLIGGLVQRCNRVEHGPVLRTAAGRSAGHVSDLEHA